MLEAGDLDEALALGRKAAVAVGRQSRCVRLGGPTKQLSGMDARRSRAIISGVSFSARSINSRFAVSLSQRMFYLRTCFRRLPHCYGEGLAQE